MIGKASEIKTSFVSEGAHGKGEERCEFYSVDDAINSFLKDLPPGTEIISIQYQTNINESGPRHHALIIYKQV